MDAPTALVKRLHSEGLPPRAIAKVSGLSTGTVFNALYALGIAKKSINRLTHLTAWEDAILLGSLLGDGHLHYRHEGRGTPHFVLSHSEKQRAYLEWKVDQLGDLFLEAVLSSNVDTDGHRSVYATSRCSALLVPYYEHFYIGARTKTITREVLKVVAHHDYRDAILSIWFGDDGYRSSGNGKSIGFVLGNLEQDMYDTVRMWFESLGYYGTLHMHRGHLSYCYLLFCVESAHRFREAVSSYLPDSMQYKLDIGPSRKIRKSRIRRDVQEV